MSSTVPSSASPSVRPYACVPIDLGERSYDIRIAPGLLDQPDTWAGLPRPRRL